jgi:ketosteroid isomerase-like protein
MPVMKMAESTTDILNRHMKAFAERNLEGVLADYSPDAIMFVPAGTLKGPKAIKPLFESLIAEFEKPGSSFTMEQQLVNGDHAYIIWRAETADNWYEFATDTFVVQNGKITTQSFAAKISPKP